MRLLHVAASIAARHGGVSVSVRELCEALAQVGLEVHLVTTLRGYDPSLDHATDQALRKAGVRVQYCPTHPNLWLGERYAYSSALWKVLKEAIPQVDVVHLHGLWLYPTQMAARLCRRFRIPYVLSPCGALDPYGMRVHRFFKLLYGYGIERITLAHAAFLHFTSPFECKTAHRFGTNPRCVVIPRSIALDRIPAVSPDTFRTAYPQLGEDPFLLFLGRIHPKKRLDLALDAFAQLAYRYPRLRFVVAGFEEGSLGHLKHFTRPPWDKRVLWIGPIGGHLKWAALKACTAFLLPSEDENFGLTVLEAMACGVPVLISTHVGIGSYLDRYPAGRALPLKRAAWIQALDELLSNPGLRRHMGKVGRRLAEEVFSTPKVVHQFMELYRRCAADRPPSR
jgi:glycosyltransferase involved in cell wall biosynthesis